MPGNERKRFIEVDLAPTLRMGYFWQMVRVAASLLLIRQSP